MSSGNPEYALKVVTVDQEKSRNEPQRIKVVKVD